MRVAAGRRRAGRKVPSWRVAACLAFAKLGVDDVEIVSDASSMARFMAWA